MFFYRKIKHIKYVLNNYAYELWTMNYKKICSARSAAQQVYRPMELEYCGLYLK